MNIIKTLIKMASRAYRYIAADHSLVLRATTNQHIINAIEDHIINYDQILQINDTYQIDALCYPSILRALEEKIIDFSQILQIHNSYQTYVLAEPLVLEALKEKVIDFNQILQISNFSQIHILEEPIILKALKEKIIDFNQILQIDYYQAEALKESIILEAFEEKAIDFNQILQIHNSYQTDVLREPLISEAFKEKSIDFNQILQIHNRDQADVLKEPAILKALKEKLIDFNRILQIDDISKKNFLKDLIHLKINILNKKAQMFFTNEDGTINYDMFWLLRSQQHIDTIEMLIGLQLFKKDTEYSKNKFTLAQALRLNNIHFRQLPRFVERLKNGSISPDDFIAFFENESEFIANIGNETTMVSAVIDERKVVTNKLNAQYGNNRNMEIDISEMEEYFNQITKQEQNNTFKKVIILGSDMKFPDKVDTNTIILQQVTLSGQAYVKASWMGYHGYETNLKLHDGNLLIGILPKNIKEALNIDSNMQTEITTSSLINDITSKFQLIKKNHVSAATKCFKRLINDPEYKKQLINIWRAIHDESAIKKESLDDALWIFANGLCEIQRAHNDHDEGRFEVDDNLLNTPDNISCSTGTLNNLIARLNGIHPIMDNDTYVPIDVLQGRARNQFDTIVTNEINKYLLQMVQDIKNNKDIDELEKLIQCFEEGDINSITNINNIMAIIETAAETIFTQYGKVAYADNKNHSQFTALTDNNYLQNIFTLINTHDEI
ncbi:MAG: hypothetical protein ACD_4C00139G0001, partial [uncultured bacterium (gcode 4)]